MYVAHGMTALTFSTLFNNATSLTLDPYLRLWGGTSLALVFGFLLLCAALLVGSDTEFRRILGGGLGALTSIIGAVNALVLLTNSVGISSSNVTQPQIVVAGQLFYISTVALLLVAFPLAMVGSFQVIREGKHEEAQM